MGRRSRRKDARAKPKTKQQQRQERLERLREALAQLEQRFTARRREKLLRPTPEQAKAADQLAQLMQRSMTEKLTYQDAVRINRLRRELGLGELFKPDTLQELKRTGGLYWDQAAGKLTERTRRETIQRIRDIAIGYATGLGTAGLIGLLMEQQDQEERERIEQLIREGKVAPGEPIRPNAPVGSALWRAYVEEKRQWLYDQRRRQMEAIWESEDAARDRRRALLALERAEKRMTELAKEARWRGDAISAAAAEAAARDIRQQRIDLWNAYREASGRKPLR